MKRFLVISLAALIAVTMTGLDAFAGAKIDINDTAKIDIGFRIQSLFVATKDDDGNSSNKFKMRRARIRLGGSVNPMVGFFLQTDIKKTDGQSNNVEIIDAFIKLKPHKLANFIIGQNMAPILRQNLTSSGGLMTIDRAGIAYKSLTWGGRAVTSMTTKVATEADAGFAGDGGINSVRDIGLTLFGSNSASDTVHYKYYLAVNNGVQNGVLGANQDNSLRYTGRVQVNFFDAEAGYYGLQTYLGKKKTVGVGFAYDTQSGIDNDGIQDVDYAMYTFDVFVEYPLGNGALNFEAAYIDLDLDDAGTLNGGNANSSGLQAQGNGYYLQAGYYINQWQPWVEYEDWSSDSVVADASSFSAFRLGVNYYLAGHNANLKLGYERTDFDGVPNANTARTDKSFDTIIAGVYITY